MLARVITFALEGIEPRRVTVEVDVTGGGLPSLAIVGLGDRSVREARERVRAAVNNSGFKFPSARVTVNLAPAYLRKAGPGYDLAIATAILVASGQADAAALADWAVSASSSLGGGSARGAVAHGGRRRNHRAASTACRPDPGTGEAALVQGIPWPG